jgi:hypothetical protein
LACVGNDALPLYEAQARERLSRAGGDNEAGKEKIPYVERGQARDKAAAATGVNPRYIQDAKKIKEESPETFEKMKTIAPGFATAHFYLRRGSTLREIFARVAEAVETFGFALFASSFAVVTDNKASDPKARPGANVAEKSAGCLDDQLAESFHSPIPMRAFVKPRNSFTIASPLGVSLFLTTSISLSSFASTALACIVNCAPG